MRVRFASFAVCVRFLGCLAATKRQEVLPNTIDISLDCNFYEGMPITKVIKVIPGQAAENIYRNRQVTERYRSLWAWKSKRPYSLDLVTPANYNGTYQCITETNLNTFTDTVHLIILQAPDKPECNWPMGNVLAKNSSVKFTCFSSVGTPAPKYKWYHNGVDITNPNIQRTKGIKISTDADGQSVLHILKVGETHKDKWHCASYNRVSSTLGQDAKTCEVRNFTVGSITQRQMLMIIVVSASSIVVIILCFVCMCFCCTRRIRHDEYGVEVEDKSCCRCCSQEEYDDDGWEADGGVVGHPGNDIEIDAQPLQARAIQKPVQKSRSSSQAGTPSRSLPPQYPTITRAHHSQTLNRSLQSSHSPQTPTTVNPYKDAPVDVHTTLLRGTAVGSVTSPRSHTTPRSQRAHTQAMEGSTLLVRMSPESSRQAHSRASNRPSLGKTVQQVSVTAHMAAQEQQFRRAQSRLHGNIRNPYDNDY